MEFQVDNTSFFQIAELFAVTFGFAYVLLAIRIHHWCWCMAFFSSTIFLWLFWNVELYLMSILQLYYMGIAIYGFLNWRPREKKIAKQIIKLEVKNHLAILSAIILPSIIIGWLLDQYSNDASPYLDTISTIGSLVTTWMVTKKILENWLYWIMIDAMSIFIYIEGELYITASLFAVYLILAVLGYHQWKSSYHRQ